jgi:hypothetical protein
MFLRLLRTNDNGFETVGMLKAYNEELREILSLVSLELAYYNNERQVSCIPCGTYPVRKRWSIKHGFHFEIMRVPNRNMILMHSGNFKRQSLGCVLVGSYFTDLDFDSEIDIASSKKALKSLYALMPKNFALIIENDF